MQDDQGFLWIGTQDGLDRFDGYSFKVYRPNPNDPTSISGGDILSLVQGIDGKIWIGTDAGLDRYDPVTDQFQAWAHDDHSPNSLANNTVQAIYQDPQRAVWVGTQGGLDRFDPAAGKFTHILLPDQPSGDGSIKTINALYMDEHRILWVGTDDGLVRYDMESRQFRVYRNIGGDNSSISFNQISAIGEDARGMVWIGTRVGLNQLDPATGEFTRYLHSDQDSTTLSDDSVQALDFDRAGELWVGTRNGLDLFDATGRQFVHYRNDPADPGSLSNNAVDTVYEDRGGILWVGTQDAGLDQHDRSQDQFAYYHHVNSDPNSLSSDVIFPILPAADGKIWIGTYDAGLNLFDPATGQSPHFVHSPSDANSLLNNTVISLWLDKQGTLWIGTHQGLDRLYPGSQNFFHYTNDTTNPTSIPFGSIYAIYQDSMSTYWVGTSQGLRIFDPATSRFSKLEARGADPAGLSDGPVMAIRQDRSGILWFGTDRHGLFRYNPTTKELEQYVNSQPDLKSLSSNSVLDIFEDANGQIWIATFGGGLDLYLPRENAFTQFRRGQGLPNDVVYGILEDRTGALWLSTNMGIARFDPKTKTFENYTEQDGLQSNEFDSSAFAEDSQGKMYFGGVKGLTIFDPMNIQKNSYIPPLVLTSLTTQDGKPVASTQTPETLQEVTLSYPQNAFDLSFSALSFSQTDKNQYKYMLQGFDKEWHTASTAHLASYTNLPGGTYTLRVLGSNDDGIWNDSGTSIQVTVVPPIWQTWEFQGLTGILFLLAVFVLYQSRVRGIQAQKVALGQLVAERTQALRRQNLDLEALYSADEKMLRVFTQDEVLQALVDLAVDVLEADKSAIFTQAAGQRGFSVRVCRGFPPETVRSAVFIESQQAVLSSVAAGQLHVVSNRPDGPRWQPPHAEIRDMMMAQDFRAIMYVPIKVQGSVLGVLSVYNSTSESTFDERRQRLFTSLVQRAALSIENSRLFEQTKQMAILEERSRLAQDLHDSAKQKAFAALAQLGAAKKLANNDHGSAAEHLVEAENIVSEVIRDLTFFIQEFYPNNLKDHGLTAAVRDYVFAWESRSGIHLELSVVGERRLPPQIEQTLYRVVQEGLSNIARHSQATQADLTLIYGGQDIEIRIRDNGAGFEPATTPHGLGLELIQERLEGIGGRADIQSRPGEGTALTIRVPILVPG